MINMQALISIILPTYNAAKYLKSCIDSIMNQTYTNFELIIINDGSVDDTDNLIKYYSDTRIRYLKNEINIGLIKTLNKGIDYAKGEYIARMDADDIATTNWLENAITGFLDAPYASVVNQRDYEMSDDGIIYWKRKFFPYLNNECLRYTQLFTTQILHPGIVIRGDVLRKYRYRDVPEALHREDFDLWRRLVKDAHYIKVLNSYAVFHRLAPQSITATQHTNTKACIQCLLNDIREEGYQLREETASYLYTPNKINKIKEACNSLSDLLNFIKVINQSHHIHPIDYKMLCLWAKCTITITELRRLKISKKPLSFIVLIIYHKIFFEKWFWINLYKLLIKEHYYIKKQ